MSRIFPLLGAMCACFGAFVSPVSAQSGLEDFVRLEVLDGGLTDKGTHRAALKVVLAEGWKTYWRAPGGSGIPPTLIWQGSQNIGQVAVTWPTPSVFDQGNVRTIGYKHQMVLPLEITLDETGQPVHLKGQLEFGLCEDICVPATLDFDRVLDANAPRSPAIAAAMAQRPYSETEAGVRAVTCLMAQTATGADLEALVLMPSSGGEEVVVIETGDPQIWTSRAIAKRDGDTLRVTTRVKHMAGTAIELDYQQVRVTVLGQKYGVDIVGCDPQNG